MSANHRDFCNLKIVPCSEVGCQNCEKMFVAVMEFAEALKPSHNTAMRKLLLDLQGYFNAERGADKYYRDYDLKERINAVVAQLPQ